MRAVRSTPEDHGLRATYRRKDNYWQFPEFAQRSLTSLSFVPDQFTLMTFPLDFHGRDGSPVQAVVVID